MVGKKIDRQGDWDDHVISSGKPIPDDIESIIGMAKELLETSIADALHFNASKLSSVEAVDWLFYSKDRQPWSFGWVMDILTSTRCANFNEKATATYRIDLMKMPGLLTAKQKFDQMVDERAIEKSFSRLRRQHQAELLTGT